MLNMTLWEAYITNDVPTLLATEQWDVLMVQLVACSLGQIPALFVEFLKSNTEATMLKGLTKYVINE